MNKTVAGIATGAVAVFLYYHLMEYKPRTMNKVMKKVAHCNQETMNWIKSKM